jgi:hypothetical protein
MVLLFWRMQCLKRQRSFPYGLEIDVWVMRQLVEMEQIHLPSAGAAGVGFDATYDALVNTLISGGLKGCCKHSL